MTNQQITDNKFEACTSYSTDVLQRFTAADIFIPYKQKYAIEEFRQKLIPYQMEEFTVPLYNYMILALRQNNNIVKKPITSSRSLLKDLLYKQELVLSLKNLISGGKIEVKIINIPGQDPYPVANKKIVEILNESATISLSDKIEELGLNQFSISEEEAEAEINNGSDSEWIKNWMESEGYLDPNYRSFTLGKFEEYCEMLELSNFVGAWQKLRQRLISEYAYDHCQEVPLTIEGLNRILDKIKQGKPKSGRPQETEELKYLAYKLSLLIRLDRYLENKAIDLIDKVHLENSDCRFVHDVLSFFSLIIDYNQNLRNKKNLEKRIRKMIGDYSDTSSIDDSNEILKILKRDIA